MPTQDEQMANLLRMRGWKVEPPPDRTPDPNCKTPGCTHVDCSAAAALEIDYYSDATD